jgi:hypothetical protein
MYVLPKALESAWSSARRRAWVPLVPFGETILGAIAMAMVMDAYKVRSNYARRNQKLILVIFRLILACSDRIIELATKDYLPVDRACLISIQQENVKTVWNYGNEIMNLYNLFVVHETTT